MLWIKLTRREDQGISVTLTNRGDIIAHAITSIRDTTLRAVTTAPLGVVGPVTKKTKMTSTTIAPTYRPSLGLSQANQ